MGLSSQEVIVVAVPVKDLFCLLCFVLFCFVFFLQKGDVRFTIKRCDSRHLSRFVLHNTSDCLSHLGGYIGVYGDTVISIYDIYSAFGVNNNQGDILLQFEYVYANGRRCSSSTR